MGQPTVPSRSSTPVRHLEPLVGGVWWTVGASALDPGPGTAVLAAGLGITAVLLVTLRRPGAGPALPRGASGRLLRLIGITAAVVAASGAVLGFVGFGELMVPVACVLVGAAFVAVSSQLGTRAPAAAGVGLLVLGAAGAVLGLNSVGAFYPQVVVGLGAAVVLWFAGAVRSGLVGLRGPVRH